MEVQVRNRVKFTWVGMLGKADGQPSFHAFPEISHKAEETKQINEKETAEIERFKIQDLDKHENEEGRTAISEELDPAFDPRVQPCPKPSPERRRSIKHVFANAISGTTACFKEDSHRILRRSIELRGNPHDSTIFFGHWPLEDTNGCSPW